MPTTQNDADKKTVGMITEKDAGGFVYTAIGGIRFYTCTGTPSHSTGVKGSLCVKVDTGKLYIDSDGAGAWKLVTSA
tara:strand:+ start:2237 stop:2467 length:231 start_codon:yes stop_codon:yes gene_type:complete